jgi:tetratricopeptide (TPR) repeat protein
MSKAIETAIHLEKWKRARRLIRARLRKEPKSHWLLTRLSLTYYEEQRYLTSLRYSRNALKLAPMCPLVLWDYAGTLQMLRKHRAAIRVYGKILTRTVTEVANGDCGEGTGRARALLADCHYRRALSYEKLEQNEIAIEDYRKHLKMRWSGCRSIYPVRNVRKLLLELTSRI